MLDPSVIQQIWSAPALVISVVASLIVMVTGLLMCVCHQKKRKNSQDHERELNEMQVILDKTQNGTPAAKVSSEAVSADVQIDVDTSVRPVSLPPQSSGSSLSSSGSKGSKRSKGHGRAKSHDHRALPEIPSSLMNQQGVMPTDDEDDDDGLYDVISGNKRSKAQAVPERVPLNGVKQARTRIYKPGHNPYEKVSGDPDSDSQTYAGIREDHNYEGVDIAAGAVLHLSTGLEVDGGEDSDSTYAGIKDSSPSASSSDVGRRSATSGGELVTAPLAVPEVIPPEVMYAQIEDKQGRPVRPRPPPEVSEPVTQVYGRAPPVPNKNYNPQEDPAPGALSPEPLDLHSSPSLPPRNSHLNGHSSGVSEGVNGRAHVYETPTDPGPSAAGAGVLVLGAGPQSDNGAAAAASALPCFTDTSTREPRYSSVTARESLDNLKRRQAHPKQLQQQQLQLRQQHLQLQTAVADADYASVDYDEIKSPGASSGGAVSPPGASADRSSLNSDLYAEIATGSARSSGYARVGDYPGSSQVAPPPPPVEVLRQLSSPRDDGEDDIPDPGYSRIKMRPRPASVHSSNAAQRGHEQPSTSGRRSPLYAMVDKSRNRQTVHVAEGALHHNASSLASHNVADGYAKVDRNAKKVLANDTATGVYDNVPLSGAFGGGGGSVVARPKVKDRGEGGGASEVIVVDPGYQTIGSVEAFNIATNQADTGSDYDPNYEKVTDLKRPTASALAAKNPSQTLTLMTTEARSDGRPRFPWQNQEHIYQEINEARQDPRQARHQRHQASERPISTGV